MAMVDFAYYKDTYLGTAIPEKAFPGMAKRAEDALQRLQRIVLRLPGQAEPVSGLLLSNADFQTGS